jgi:protein-disulfide isomerase
MKLGSGLFIAIVLSVIGVYYFIPNKHTKTKLNTAQTLISAKTAKSQPLVDLVIGSAGAKVTMVEYADFKCPECGKFHQNAGQLLRKNYVDTGKLRIIFKPYPVYGDDAGKALYVSYCANEQNKFPVYHDAVFQYMWDNYYKKGDYNAAIADSLNDTVLFGITDKLGLNKKQLLACIDHNTYDNSFQKALLDSGPDEIQGTPSFLLNGEKIVGPQPYNLFKTLVDIRLRIVEVNSF